MAQAELSTRRMSGSESNCENEIAIINIHKKKVSFNLDGRHHLSLFKNEKNKGIINIRCGTRSVTISKEAMMQICEIKDTILQCLEFIDN